MTQETYCLRVERGTHSTSSFLNYSYRGTPSVYRRLIACALELLAQGLSIQDMRKPPNLPKITSLQLLPWAFPTDHEITNLLDTLGDSYCVWEKQKFRF